MQVLKHIHCTVHSLPVTEGAVAALELADLHSNGLSAKQPTVSMYMLTVIGESVANTTVLGGWGPDH